MKKLKQFILFLIACMSFCFPVSAAVTSVQVQPFGSSVQYLEASAGNIPVLHIHINAAGSDTMTYLEVINQLNSWYQGSANETDSIAAGKVKLWYMAVDSAGFSAGSPVYVTHLARSLSDGTDWSNTFSRAVVDGSGFWVTVDVQNSPVSLPTGSLGTMEMQTQSLIFSGAPGVNSTKQPAAPSVFIVTDVTPSQNLEVTSVLGTMQANVSTGQDNVIPMELDFYNNSSQTAAEININTIAFTVESSPGAVIAPSSILADIKLIDKTQGIKYGEVAQTMIPGTPAVISMALSSLNVPAGVTIQANVQITLTSLNNLANSDFIIGVLASSDIDAFDYYTRQNVSVTMVPLRSRTSTFQKACQTINASYTTILPDPKSINKGSTNVELIKFYFDNPGDLSTASAEISSLKLFVTDSTGAGIIPKDLFSKISLTDETGNTKYKVKTTESLEGTGNSISFAMTNTNIPSASGVTVVVRADISAASVINNFRISLTGASDITCSDKNSMATVTAVFTQALPYSSPLCILSSSFNVSHKSYMPANIYPGQPSVKAMDISFSSPRSFGNGTILVSGITLTAKNAAGNTINFSEAASKIRIVYGLATVELTAPVSNTAYIAFSEAIAIPALPSAASLTVYLDFLDSITAASIQVVLEKTSINAYQNNEITREIFVSADTNESFPMTSGIGYISSDTSGISFTNYPNPFKNGSSTVLAYYLKETSEVSISVFDMSGSLIREICKKVSKPAGSHEDSTWNGTDRTGRSVLAGTYIIRIEVKNASGTKKYTRKATLIK